MLPNPGSQQESDTLLHAGASPDAADAEPFFRPEVFEQSKAQWLGPILLKPKISSTIFVAAAIVAGIAVLSLLFAGSFTRKAHIAGWLVPEQGLARIYPPQSGVVRNLLVSEGMTVAAGQPLVVLSSEVETQNAGATRTQIVQQLRKRRDSLVEAKAVQQRLFDEQRLELQRRSLARMSERLSLAGELEAEKGRFVSVELSRDRSMRARDLSTLGGSNESEARYLAESAKVQALERGLMAFDSESLRLHSSLRSLPLQRHNEIAEFDRKIAEIEQQLAEAEARRQILITAPHAGTVTGVQAELGGHLNPNAPVMSIVPSGSVLQAQLFGPSRAIGFVRPGQRVLLRYEAFAYQKFGLYEGVIRNVARSAISPSEMTQQLAGLASLYGANEPIYRVTVELAQQNVNAYGSQVPLQPGMKVEADVMVETRKLFEWILDPLYSLTGKL